MDTLRPETGDLRRDYLTALTSIRKWKSFFLLLAVLCLATHAGAWAAVRFGWVPASPRAVTGFEGDAANATQPSLTERERAEKMWNVMRAALPTTEFVGRLSALLLCLSLLVAVQVALVGRMPVAGILQAFFWTMIVLALLMPWERLAQNSTRLPGVFTDVATLEMPAEDGASPSTMSKLVAPLRFVGYPLLAVLMLVWANGRFHRSFREAMAQPGTNIPMRVV